MLLPNGHQKLFFTAADQARTLVDEQNWGELDALAQQWLAPEGVLHQQLKKYCSFTKVEHILALRQAPDDDGIWHDDGSRLLAFSLSLTVDHQAVAGGVLQLRHKENLRQTSFPCQPWGTLLLFNTGIDQYEHRVIGVSTGKRLVMAGWCS